MSLYNHTYQPAACQSHPLHHEAAEILYSTNKFHFTRNIMETLPMLQAMRPNTLKLLRSVTLKGEKIGGIPCQISSWLPLFELMNADMNVPRLNLCIDLFDDTELHREENYESMTRAAYNLYIDIARTVKGFQVCRLFISSLFCFQIWKACWKRSSWVSIL